MVRQERDSEQVTAARDRPRGSLVTGRRHTVTHMRTGSRYLPIAACALAGVAALTSCGTPGEASGELAPPDEADDAYTYDTDAAPPGAELEVKTPPIESGTQVELAAEGLQPNRAYGAHAHVRECGETGDAAGPHFQNERDPKQGVSVDPEYANPQNEIWLDFTTDGQGSGSAIAQVPFMFGDRVPASVVLHEETTASFQGEAGDAGARLACLNVEFVTE